MFHTDLVLSGDLESFDKRNLRSFGHYVFIILASPDDIQMNLEKFAPTLAACDSLCFLLDHSGLEKLKADDVLKALFSVATDTVPQDAVTYIACISRKDLLDGGAPRGRWHELFLLNEPTLEAKEKKLRAGIQAALADKSRDFTGLSAFAGQMGLALFKWLLPPHA